MIESLPSFDPDALARLRRFGGGRLLAEMIDLFLAVAPERVRSARAALVAGDAAGVAFAAHALVSSAGQLGAPVLQARCLELERGAAAGALDVLRPRLDALDAELARVSDWLRGERELPA